MEPTTPTKTFTVGEIAEDTPIKYEYPAPASRGGRGRGRGRRGRGGRGARGGRAPAAEKPAVTINPQSRWRMRGRARKVLDNPRIQAVLDRRHELKRQYRVLTIFQKAGLSVIQERSYNKLNKDPEYHKTFPEYEEIERRLQKQEDSVAAIHDREMELELDLARRIFEQNTDYEHKTYDYKVQELREEYEEVMMDQAAYIYHQGVNGGPIEEFTWAQKSTDGKWELPLVEKDLPPQVVHSIGNPFHVPPFEPNSYFAQSTEGDNELEQHPSNWWKQLNAKQKEGILKGQDRVIKARIARKSTKQKRTGGKSSSLLQTQTLRNGNEAPELEDGEAAPPSSLDTPEDSPSSSPSPPNTNGLRPFPVDKHGVGLPGKKLRVGGPSYVNYESRFVLKKNPVTFEEHEIGLRTHNYRNKGYSHEVYLGPDPSPNPKAFHLDQYARKINTALNERGDLDEQLVAEHKVHPLFGFSLPDSTNNDPGSKDWTSMGSSHNNKPYRVIETNRHGEAREYTSSRSHWRIEAERRSKSLPPKMKIRDILRALGELEEPETAPLPEPEPDIPQVLSQELVDAANKAMRDGEREGHQQVRQAQAVVEVVPSVPPAPPAPPAPQVHPAPSAPSSRARYDPVRDITSYQTPYQPVRFSRYREGGPLAALADAVNIPAPLYPPQPLHQQPQQPQQHQWYPSPYPAQQYSVPAPPAVPQTHHSFIPYNYHTSQQYLPPRPPAGGLRELRPAPQNRPPPPPPQGWWP